MHEFFARNYPSISACSCRHAHALRLTYAKRVNSTFAADGIYSYKLICLYQVILIVIASAITRELRDTVGVFLCATLRLVSRLGRCFCCAEPSTGRPHPPEAQSLTQV